MITDYWTASDSTYADVNIIIMIKLIETVAFL